MSVTPKSTRSRKGSIKDSLTLNDISELIRQSEERIIGFVKNELSQLSDKLTKIESCLSSVQTECVRLDQEVSKMKVILSNQQMQIENHERKVREKNIIMHNIPETDLPVGPEILKGDKQKIMFLCSKTNTDISQDDIVSHRRLGKRQPNKSRPIKIEMKDVSQKYKFLNNRKNISINQDVREVFSNRIFVNADSSFLVQKEEFRLRQKLKEVKEDEPNVTAYIRAGCLYVDGHITDKVDIHNQLF